MLTGASVDALDPERAHVTLLVAAVSVGVLQGLLNSLSGYPYAVLGPAPEPLCKLQYPVLMHLSFFLCSAYSHTHANKQTQTQLNVMVQSLTALSTKEFYQYRKYPTQYEYQLVRDVIVTQCGWVEEEGFRLECQV